MKSLIILTFTTMFTGTIISISSSSWIVAWMGMELNIMGFLPLIITNSAHSKEASMKYFVIQTLSSSILIMTSSISMLIPSHSIISNLIIITLATKMALAPLHSWLPKVIEPLKWTTIFLMLTWQKIPPLILISQISSNNILILFVISSAMIGSIMMMNQTSMKKIMAYSSITHFSWIIMTLFINKSLSLTNFLIYFLSLIPTILIMNMFNILSIKQMKNLNISSKILLTISLLSMASFPPLLTFFQKMVVITSSTPYTPLLPMIIILLMSSTLALFSYIHIMFTPMMSPQSPMKINFFLAPLKFTFMLISISILNFLPISFLIFSPN